MEKNLEIVLRKMFEIAGAEYPNDDNYFKSANWYQQNTWTKEQEDKFIKWFATFVMKNWDGVLGRKPHNKRVAERAADQFNFAYGFKVVE